MKVKIEGMKELNKSLQRLGETPQKHVTSSVRKGMNISFKDAKAKAPIETGELKSGIKMVGEKSRIKGKKVYQIVFDRAKNDIFQKRNKEGKVIGYYPTSMEYGFFARNGRYIPGYHFLKKALEENSGKVEKTIIEEMQKKIDKELGK
ncbi:MAG: HK97 gp10 family phage protein [Clostridium sp.]|uniref:HK97-gp10 family putative phage morphogenesis protein n=1 Tax=Clostridium sp. TaxID=1506 RepID=UPI00290A7B43|nr:HK97-gp10 family putative phage morphogenesis protein [Clostridium sp.]MDU5108894.1 HK97 gp10 family phage protein [Clostridium sp.]